MRFPGPGQRGRGLLLVILGGVVGASVVVIGIGAAGRLRPVSAPQAAASPSATPSSRGPRALPPVVPSPEAEAMPLRLLIPSIAVNAAVEDVGIDANGAMGVPSNVNDTAWYQNGPSPGQPGDAVIDGHLDWYTGSAVFARLGDLKPGDRIEVTTSMGTQVNFQVKSLEQFPYTAQVPGLFASGGPPELSLITCAGQWDSSRQVYLNRLVVTATEQSP